MDHSDRSLSIPTRIAEYDILRVIACMLVVVGHAALASHAQKTDASSPFVDFFEHICNIVYSFHMPLFFALSGACAVMKPLGITKSMIKKRAERLLVPHFTIGALFAIPVFCFCLHREAAELYTQLFTLNYGSSLYIWFLPALFVVSMLTATIHRIVKSHSLAMMFVLLLSSVAFVAGHSIHTAFVPLAAICDYWVWYAAGVYFLPYLIQWQATNKLFLTLTSLCMFGVCIWFYDFRISTPYEAQVSGGHLVFSCFSVFVGSLTCILGAKLLSSLHCETCGWFRVLLASSMSIYLYHLPFHWIVAKLSREYGWMDSHVGICAFYLCRFVVATLISLLIWFAIRNMKGKWKAVLGS